MHPLLFALYVSFWSFFHVGHIAEYRYQQREDTVYLKFTIEKHELLSFKLSASCDVQQLTALCTTKYLNKNALLRINGQPLDFELSNSYTQKDHLIIEMQAILKQGPIEHIQVSNTSFYEFKTTFKNRVLIDIQPFKRSYLLTKNRSSIHLKP